MDKKRTQQPKTPSRKNPYAEKIAAALQEALAWAEGKKVRVKMREVELSDLRRADVSLPNRNDCEK